MANPRKFSEKIALHHQKQAEETAAFEAIMKEVGALPKKPPGGLVEGHQHLHIHPEANSHLGTYRGGSLPNVNAIDLQSALHSLEDMKQPNTSRQTLVERLTRDRARHIPARRQLGMDKRVPAMECSPYGSAFLSPPLDTNWRRTNSDSALHTSAMAPISQSILPNTPPTNRRVLEQTSSMDSQVGLAGGGSQLLDPKRIIQPRPRSCEMPRIENSLPPGWLRTEQQTSIYPSPEQDSGLASHVPISSNTGSLPDLTTLHFPPPLTTPLDTDDGVSYPTSPSSLSPSPVMHLQSQQQASPGPRRRPPHGTPSPLVLHGSPTQLRHNVGLQGSSLEGARVSSEGRLHQQFHPYHIHPPHHHPQPHQHTQQQQPTNPASSPSPEHQRLHSSINSLSPSQSTGLTYRNGVVECPASPSSPLSQQSYSPSQSPSNLSPSVVSGSPFSDPYYPPQSPQQQQQQQQQANALQHRFEQFNMFSLPNPLKPDFKSMMKMVLEQRQQLQENHPKTSTSVLCSMVSGLPSMPFTQQLASSPDFTTLGQFAFPQGGQPPGSPVAVSPQPPPSPLATQSPSGQHMTSSEQMVPVSSHQQTNNSIPDIILTGVDDPLSRQDFAKELSSAMAMAESLTDSDFFPTDEVLKVGLDPLDLDGLQMLTESSLITDPATEESFRQDRS